MITYTLIVVWLELKKLIEFKIDIGPTLLKAPYKSEFTVPIYCSLTLHCIVHMKCGNKMCLNYKSAFELQV